MGPGQKVWHCSSQLTRRLPSARCWCRCLTSGSCCWCVGYSIQMHTDAVTPHLYAGCPNPTLGAAFPTVPTRALMFSTRFQSPQTQVCLVIGGQKISVCFQFKKHLQRTKSDMSLALDQTLDPLFERLCSTKSSFHIFSFFFLSSH